MIILTVPEAATLCSVTEKTIHAWVAEGAPTLERGTGGRGRKTTLPGALFVQWVMERQRPQRELAAERARLAQAQADKTEIEVLELRRQLMPIENVRDTWRPLRRMMARHVSKIPGKVAEALGPAAFDAIKPLIDEALGELPIAAPTSLVEASKR